MKKYLIFILLGILSTQRYSLTILYSYVCLIPLLLAIKSFLKNDFSRSITWIVICLFCVIDYGGPIYFTSTFFVRTICKVLGLLILVNHCLNQKIKYQTHPVYLICLLVFLYGLINFLSNKSTSDLVTFGRDSLVLFLAILILNRKTNTKMDFQVIFQFGIGMLIGEITNIFLFYKDGYYLNYTGLKCVVCFPAIWVVYKRKNIFVELVYIAVTLVITTLYASKLVLYSFVLIFGYLKIFQIFRYKDYKAVSIYVLIVLGAYFYIPISVTEKYRALQPLYNLQVNSSNLQEGIDTLAFFQDMDNIRFVEHQLFLNRPWYKIVLGDGLGAGIYDINGVLNFVTEDDDAFSDKEIQQTTYFNLHDTHIDLGLRFGIFLTAIPYFILIRNLLLYRSVIKSAILLMVLINSMFSTTGLLMFFIIISQEIDD